MKNTMLILLLLLIKTGLCFGQTVTYLVSNHTVEYECLPGCITFEKDLINKWMVTNLEKDVIYNISISYPTIFDAVVFEPHSPFWEIDNNSDPYSQYWKWTGQTTTRDTFDLYVASDYPSLESGVEQWFRFTINIPNQTGSQAFSGVNIASSMELTGPSIVCGTTATYTLTNLPLYKCSSSWVIKQIVIQGHPVLEQLLQPLI